MSAKQAGVTGTNQAVPGYSNTGYSNIPSAQGLTNVYPSGNALSGYTHQYTGTIVATNPEPEFDLSQLGTIVVGDNDNSTNSNRGYYFLLLSVDGDRLAYLVAASKYDNSVINWKTPSKMVEFLGEFDLLNQHWVDFKSKAIGYIMGKFELDASK